MGFNSYFITIENQFPETTLEKDFEFNQFSLLKAFQDLLFFSNVSECCNLLINLKTVIGLVVISGRISNFL
ncbi:hypothetical protein B2D45_02845 [Lactobacillus hilgardii]|uniref:Uncharacterized protein n=1 Tax=Lentilactobacillus hilgardii (strain ATCC 8290 / DSM 20176 / CCUG 30140 / JCM 1155 / KCTC 3500 / NBRC 15886 / NCIMB 8040 / NRRL B-1843 / 9) TaxID=1423757 RepID=C0XK13_LENH9|nr:hypothetical protein HMPREF0497_0784 [Lentilactobacillus buchneri ATCC 11577]EEI24281.1 hypothetical protein HMPREF0519_1574 [Lentilactobacillus hilgardii DSM 20176 = ATCC 8290]MCT3395361.1 hypothetical protein [Lentilactobacillus hilgardii]QEU37899.1 hypothetical protein LH500_02520 [Lentilactobacillus hilgardii]